jgi:hypothetical protein
MGCCVEAQRVARLIGQVDNDAAEVVCVCAREREREREREKEKESQSLTNNDSDSILDHLK